MVDAGTYAFGLGANNDPATGSPKWVIVVSSSGYDDTCSLTTISRTIYGTKQVRKPYPDNALNDETESGGNVTSRVALSDYIYSGDTVVSTAILSGLYNDGANASLAGTPSATNSSTLAYPKVTANWSWPGYQLMDSTTKLRCVAFSPHAQQGRPVRAVKFTVTDGTTTNTEIVLAPTYDASMGDAVPVVEYVTTTDLTAGLTQGAELTCNFIAYPWVGDADSVLDTSTGTAAPTPLFGPIKAVCNRTGAYQVTCALVDDTGGSDAGANTVYPASSFDPATAYKFATIGKAAAAIAAYNNANYSRNDGGAGVVYLADGNYVWAGSSNSYGTTPKTWLTVTRASNSTNRAAVVITSANNDKALGGRTKLTDITITSSTAIQHSGEAALWLDRCDINYTGAAFVYGDGMTTWATRNTLTAVAGGFGPYSNGTSRLALLRGNTITTNLTCPAFFTVLGNNRHTTTQTSVLGVSSAGVAFADNKILAFNRWMKVNQSSLFTVNNVAVSRFAVVQNIFEAIGTTTGPLNSLFADGGTSGDALNIIIWHNVTVGQRINQAYCSTGANNPLRVGWSVKNNITDDFAMKTDTFTGDGGANGVRVGNWSQLYGVGSSGNAYQAVNDITANSSVQEFWGLKTLRATSVAATYMAYTNRLAWIGTGGASTGNGDYTLTKDSPAINMQRDWVLPYDLAGIYRTATSAAGAYHYGTATPVGYWW